MEEISLRELIEILIKRKNIIIFITAFAVLAAGILSFFVLSPQYEAKMILMASNLSGQIQSNGENGNGNVDSMLDAISQYPNMNLETYREQVKTPEVMRKTIEDLNLEKEYTADSLANSITLETVDSTELISIKMQNMDPEKAAQIVNKVGQNFIEVVENNVKKRANKASQDIERQMTIEKEKYDEALLEQKELLSQPRNADELQMELNAKLNQITSYKTKINDLTIREDELESAIVAAENDPSRTNSLTIRQSSSNSGTMNLVLDDTEKALKIDLAEVQASIESTTNEIADIETDIEELRVELQDKAHKERLINQKVDIAQTTYEAFVEKYEELKVTESTEIGESSISVISSAHPSNNPVAPRKALNVAISLVLGVMIGVFVAFFMEYWQSTGDDIKLDQEKI